MDRAALPGDIVSAGGVTLTDGAMAVGDRDGAIFTGGVMFGDGTMMASAALLMDGVEGAIFIGNVTLLRALRPDVGGWVTLSPRYLGWQAFGLLMGAGLPTRRF